MTRRGKPAKQDAFAWVLGNPKLWAINGKQRRIEYTGDLGSWLSRAYEPAYRDGLWEDFVALGRLASATANPEASRTIQHLALRFVKEYGPLVEDAYDMDASPPITVDLRRFTREAAKAHETMQHAIAAADDPNRMELVRHEVNKHLVGVHPVLRERGGELVFYETYDTLLTAIWLKLAKSVTSAQLPRRCKNPKCLRLFAASREDQEYHDAACRNRAHAARKYAERSKERTR